MREPEKTSKLVEFNANQRFGEDISRHVFCSAMIEEDDAVVVRFANVMVSDCNMFSVGMEGRVLDKFNHRLVVRVEDDRIVEHEGRVKLGKKVVNPSGQ